MEDESNRSSVSQGSSLRRSAGAPGTPRTPGLPGTPVPPGTPGSNRSSVSRTDSRMKPGRRLKQLLTKGKRDASDASGMPMSRGASVELPRIVPLRSRDHRNSVGPFKDQSSPIHVDSASATLAGGRSEVNSVLNLPVQSQPASPHLALPQMAGDLLAPSRPSRPASTVSHSTDGEASGHPDTKGGLISSLFNAAASHINTIGQDAAPDAPQEKSRLADVLTTLKGLAPDARTHAAAAAAAAAPAAASTPDVYGDHISDLVASQPQAQRRSASPITRGITFEPVKETPLSTLGKGQLSLEHFDHKRTGLAGTRTPRGDEMQQVTTAAAAAAAAGAGVPIPAISRLASPAGRGARGNSKSVSPGRGSRTNGRGSIDAEMKRRLSRKASKRLAGTAASDDVDTSSIRSAANGTGNGNENDTVSPALSRVVTNGASRPRPRAAKLSIANQKRQAEFHQVFKQIPQAEKLLDDHSCALQKEILVQGRLYISTAHLCFNSNILGWVTNFVIPFAEIIQIEKKNTAGVFPNAIAVQTLHSKSVFASFLAREATFDAITFVWNRNIHTGGRESLYYEYGHESDSESVANESGDTDVSDSDESGYDSDDDGRGGGLDDSDGADGYTSDDDATSSTSSADDGAVDKSGAKSAAAGPENEFNGIKFAGPRTHAPTDAGHEKRADETVIGDDVIAAPLGVVYQLLFGNDTAFVRRALEKAKNFDLSEIPKFGGDALPKTRQYSYTKPLGGPVGPKQTRCNITETLEFCDFASAVRATQVSRTPDVPSGNSFTVKSFFLLSWGSNNSTHLVVLTAVEWTAKSWIKGAVEKGSIEGQRESVKQLVAELNAKVAAPARKRSATVGKRRRRTKDTEPEPAASPAPVPVSDRGTLAQIAAAVYDVWPAVLVAFVVIAVGAWFGLGGRGGRSRQFRALDNIRIENQDYILLPSTYRSRNYLADEAEYDLWTWIDRRNGHVGAGAGADTGADAAGAGASAQASAKLPHHNRQSLEEAVSITQRKLDHLRALLDRAP